MTYRERRERKAERLRGWAEKRTEAANAIERGDRSIREDMRFVAAQPGIGASPGWKRIMRREEREYENRDKAASMTSRAAGIEAQLDRSIYSDDEDAIERLEERIAALEARREHMKQTNAAFRKAHRTELAALSPYDRDQAMPFPAYAGSNLTGDIARNRKRLAALRAAASETDPRPLRVIQARRAGSCERCGDAIEVGAYIGKYADGWSHVSGTPWARCATTPA